MNIRCLRYERGQDLVEYAIIVPIFILFVMFIADFGRLVYYTSAVHNAAREGARYAIVHLDDSNFEENLRTRVENLAVALDPADLTITPMAAGDDHMQVTVTYRFYPVTPFVNSLLGVTPGDPLQVSSQSRMRIEQ